ncbi:MAG: V-type ATP synthase subunit F [Spirochaetaceae bacterium]|nr:V-type ATP synthase subunit F [Spirochaetaceae bacterium]
MDYFFIGDEELVTAFRFVGIDGEAVRDAAQTREAFLKITQGWNETAGMILPQAESCRVLIMTEEAADALGDELTQWQLSGHYPLVVEVPGMMGKLESRKTLMDSIREAIGIRV